MGRNLVDPNPQGVIIDYFNPIYKHILKNGYKWTPTLDSVIEPPNKLYEYIEDFKEKVLSQNDP